MERVPPETGALIAHEAFVRAIARRLVLDESRVDDVVQETWLAALRKSPGKGGALRAWLGAVARNLALKSRRTDARRARRESAMAKSDRVDSTAEVVQRAEQSRRVVDAVLALDEPHRSTILLRYFDNESSREIATRFGISQAAVRKRLKRAFDLVRLRLDEMHGRDRRAWCIALVPIAHDASGRLSGPTALVSAKATLGVGVLAVSAALVMLALSAVDTGEPTRMPSGGHHAAQTNPAPTSTDLRVVSVDRDLDVHGVIVDVDGNPVPDALVQAVFFPLRRIGAFDHAARFVERSGPACRTARDGSFVLRLRRGQEAHLRVHASGFAVQDVPRVQAGEKVRVRVGPPVRFAVQVRDARGTSVSGAHVRLLRSDARGQLTYFSREGLTDEHGTSTFTVAGGGGVWVVAEHASLGAKRVRVALPVQGSGSMAITIPDGLSVSGRVVDAQTGVPVAGARVGLNLRLDNAALTDGEGHYRLSGVEERCSVRVQAKDYTAGAAYITCLDPLSHRTKDGSLAKNVQTIDFELERGDTVIGRVLSSDGAPIKDAFVAVQHSNELWYAESDSSGKFRLRGVRPELPGRALTVFTHRRGRVRRLLKAHGTVNVGDIVLPPPSAIEGRLVTADGTPVSRRLVVLRLARSSETRYTDDLGRFRFPDLSLGRYQITAHSLRFRQFVELTGAQDRLEVEIRLEDRRQLRVYVHDVDGQPVASAVVRDDLGAQARTDKDGRALLSLSASAATVYVSPPIRGRQTRYRPPAPQRLEGGERSLRFVLDIVGVARGKVLAPGGDRVPGAQIHVWSSAERIGAGITDREGNFAVAVPRSGSVDVVVPGHALPGHNYILVGRLRDVVAGARDLVLWTRAVEAAQSLRVRVVAPDGTAIENALVTARPGLQARGTLTNARGRAELLELPHAQVTVEVVLGENNPATGRWLLPRPVRVVPEGQEISLPMREGLVVTGWVLRPDGLPAPGAGVFAYEDDRAVSHGRADAHGAFTLLVEPNTARLLRLDAIRFEAGVLFKASVTRVAPGSSNIHLPLRRE